jgi:hypothetical protein
VSLATSQCVCHSLTASPPPPQPPQLVSGLGDAAVTSFIDDPSCDVLVAAVDSVSVSLHRSCERSNPRLIHVWSVCVWYATSCTQTVLLVATTNSLGVCLWGATQRDATAHTNSDRPSQHHAVIRILRAYCSRLSNVWDTTLASLTSASARNHFAVWFMVLKRFSFVSRHWSHSA